MGLETKDQGQDRVNDMKGLDFTGNKQLIVESSFCYVCDTFSNPISKCIRMQQLSCFEMLSS